MQVIGKGLPLATFLIFSTAIVFAQLATDCDPPAAPQGDSAPPVVPPSVVFTAALKIKVSLLSINNDYLSAVPATLNHVYALELKWMPHSQGWEHFIVETIPGKEGQITIKTHFNKYLAVQSVVNKLYLVEDNQHPDSIFLIKHDQQNVVFLQSIHGYFFSRAEGGCMVPSSALNEQFRLFVEEQVDVALNSLVNYLKATPRLSYTQKPADNPKPRGQEAPIIDTDVDMYAIMQLSRDVTQLELRRAYRALSLKYHPDRNPNDPSAAKRFADINMAYEVLGDPDKRAIYDDLGSGNDQGFETLWEFQQSKRKSTKDFYVGDRLIQGLTDANWDERVRGDQPWVVEFYAPWCTHCITATQKFKQSAEALDGDFEFGAVNGVNNPALAQRFHVNAYPTFVVFAPKWEVQAQFNWQGPDSLISNLPGWVREMQLEWDKLFRSTNVVFLDTSESLQQNVIDSPDVWVVMYTNGPSCSLCSDAKPNFFRLSTDVMGLVKVGIHDCHKFRDNCNQMGISHQDFPHYYIYAAGNKSTPDRRKGDLLFSKNDIQTHVALPLIAKALRAALATSLTADDTALRVPLPDDPEYVAEETPEPQKPQAPPKYHVPPAQPRFAQLPSGTQNRAPRLN